MNDDGKLDIIVANWGDDNASVLLNIGNGMFAAPIAGPAVIGFYPWSAIVADVNGDGKLDKIVDNWSTNNVGVLINTGSITFTAETTYSPDQTIRYQIR